jgi:hypothetical protein
MNLVAGRVTSFVPRGDDTEGAQIKPAPVRTMELHMEYADQKSLSYRMALRRFDSAFADCDRLAEAEKHLLLREIGMRLLERMPQPKPDVSAVSQHEVKITGMSIKEEAPNSGGKS